LRKRYRKNGKRRTYYTENKHLDIVTEAIRSYGAEHNIAVWDWYTIGGGEGACDTWVKENGMRKDHIHYTAQGYALQGHLLYQSILKAYEEYIR
jgi:lysophospholipase L1-like esterase